MARYDRVRYNERPSARAIGALIFTSRWLQAPLYVGLIVAQLVYVIVFLIELWHLVQHDVLETVAHGGLPEEATIMLGVLGLIDVVMIANLLIMVIIGGYETFVSKIDLREHPDEPEWLSHVNANVLKVKLAMAIIGISSIHLLKSFIEVSNIVPGQPSSDVTTAVTIDGVLWQCVIHGMFILSAVALALIDRMQVSDARGAGHAGEHDRRGTTAGDVEGASDGDR